MEDRLKWMIAPEADAAGGELNAERDAEVFRAFIETLPDALIVVDREGRICMANRVATALFGYEADSLIGEEIEVLIPAKARVAHQSRRSSYVSDPIAMPMGSGGVRQGLRKDDSSFPVEISLSPLKLCGEDRVSAIVRDVTDRVAIQEQLRTQAADLERSNRELEQFAYVASHDLREPLRTVSSYAQLLARRYEAKLGADADEYIERIVDGAARMNNLIEDLLAYSRAGSSAAPFVECDLDGILVAVLDTLQGRVQDSGAEVTVEPLPRLVAVSSELELLFQNLIANALKFRGEAAPRVRVRSEEREDGWEFFVEDNGVGIDARYATKIFDMFDRGGAKGRFPGTGIGLAICKKVVDRHGGRISFDSNEQGTTFRFTLPRLECAGGDGTKVESRA